MMAFSLVCERERQMVSNPRGRKRIYIAGVPFCFAGVVVSSLSLSVFILYFFMCGQPEALLKKKKKTRIWCQAWITISCRHSLPFTPLQHSDVPLPCSLPRDSNRVYTPSVTTLLQLTWPCVISLIGLFTYENKNKKKLKSVSHGRDKQGLWFLHHFVNPALDKTTLLA